MSVFRYMVEMDGRPTIALVVMSKLLFSVCMWNCHRSDFFLVNSFESRKKSSASRFLS